MTLLEVARRNRSVGDQANTLNETLFIVKSSWLQVFQNSKKGLTVVSKSELTTTGHCGTQQALACQVMPVCL